MKSKKSLKLKRRKKKKRRRRRRKSLSSFNQKFQLSKIKSLRGKSSRYMLVGQVVTWEVPFGSYSVLSMELIRRDGNKLSSEIACVVTQFKRTSFSMTNLLVKWSLAQFFWT
jgi:hypothetical protein